ncbi:MAG: site-specific integrase [Dehalococcoidia bacterium]|nr:MAG: site-specific integrase [Dehalococcoidia bacterium]
MAGSIYQRKGYPNRWYIVVDGEPVNGKRKQVVTSIKRGTKETKRGIVQEPPGEFEARAKEALVTQLHNRKVGQIVNDGNKRIADVFEGWKAAHFPDVRASTRARYLSAYKNHIEPAIGALTLARLNVGHVERLYRGMTTKGKGKRERTASMSSVRNCRSVLNPMLDYAVRHGLTSRNVAQIAKLPKDQNEGKNRLAGLPDDQGIARILAEADKEGQTVSTLARTVLYTGVRLGEALGLTWESIDLDNPKPKLRVEQARSGNDGSYGALKNEWSRRAIGLDTGTVAALSALAAARPVDIGTGKPAGLVFLTVDGEGLSHHRAERIWKMITKRAGAPKMRVHDCRHWHASDLDRKGVPHAEIARRLGHKNLATFYAVYSHALKGGDDTAVAALNAGAAGGTA